MPSVREKDHQTVLVYQQVFSRLLIMSLSFSHDDSIGLGKLQLTSKAAQEEGFIDNMLHKTLSIADLPDDCLGLVYQSLKSSTDYNTFSLVCRHWLHIQNRNHESLWDINDSQCSLRDSQIISPESFSIILCKLLIRFQNLKRLSLSCLPEVDTDYVTSQSQFFGSKIQFLCVKDCFDYSDKKLSLIFSLFPSMASVRLSGTSITDKGLEVLANCCASLKNVDLRECHQITDLGLENLANCLSLETVKLGNCEGITDNGLGVLSKCCASLEKIDLRSCQGITHKGVETLAKYCRSLKKVILADCQGITDESLEVLAKYCASLEKVDLGSCQCITDKGLEVMAKCCASLEYVNLWDCQGITDKGLEVMAKSCASLETVRLGDGQRITDSGINLLMQNCSKLRTLSILFCESVTGIGFLGCPKTMTDVDASFMPKLTTEGIKAIVCGGGIEYLNLLGTPVTNEAVITISESCPLLKKFLLDSCKEVPWKAIGLYCKNLEVLHVAGCQNICDQGLKALCYGCTKLSYLFVDSWSDFGVELFKRERPDVRILGAMPHKHCNKLSLLILFGHVLRYFLQWLFRCLFCYMYERFTF